MPATTVPSPPLVQVTAGSDAMALPNWSVPRAVNEAIPFTAMLTLVGETLRPERVWLTVAVRSLWAVKPYWSTTVARKV